MSPVFGKAPGQDQLNYIIESYDIGKKKIILIFRKRS